MLHSKSENIFYILCIFLRIIFYKNYIIVNLIVVIHNKIYYLLLDE